MAETEPENLIEEMNCQLHEFAEEKAEKVEETSIPRVKKRTPKKNSKRDIISRMFEVSEKYNLPLEETEQTLMRKSRKRLLELLADLIEKSVEAKVKSQKTEIPPECHASQLPMLRIAHTFFANLIEKGFNCGTTYLEYDYKLEGYAEACNRNPLIDDTLLQIAEEMGPELTSLISNPWIRLSFIHVSSVMTCLHYVDRTQMLSPRINV